MPTEHQPPSESESDSTQPNLDQTETIIPRGKGTYPISRIDFPPELLRTLANAEPSELLTFFQDQQEIIRERQKGELEIQKGELELQQEAIRSQSQARAEERGLIRFGIGAFCLIFTLVLIYSGITGDTSLPDQLLTLASGLIGGGGAVAFLQRNRKDRGVGRSEDK